MIQVGCTYKTNSKRSPTIVIIEIDGNDSHPLIGLDNRKRMFRFTKEGKFVSSEFKHEMDLYDQRS